MRVFDFSRGSDPTVSRYHVAHNPNTGECVLEIIPEGKSIPRWEIRLTQVDRENLIRDLNEITGSITTIKDDVDEAVSSIEEAQS